MSEHVTIAKYNFPAVINHNLSIEVTIITMMMRGISDTLSCGQVQQPSVKAFPLPMQIHGISMGLRIPSLSPRARIQNRSKQSGARLEEEPHRLMEGPKALRCESKEKFPTT